MSVETTGQVLAPPDPVGDVGPNHYVQMVNLAFAVFDKSTGSTILAPTPINQLWIDAGVDVSDPCRASNEGDPIALYDQFADRWLLSQTNFSSNSVCIALSQGPDPTGSYYVYTFPLGMLPDVPKYGVWPDAYLLGLRTVASVPGEHGAAALDRLSMLDGEPVTMVIFSGETNLLMPADADGPTPPPVSAPGVFYTFKDDTFFGTEPGGLVDRLEIYELDPDFATPGNSTFSRVQSIEIAPFNFTVCGFFMTSCISQLGTGQLLDPRSEWPMHRLQYRNFGTHETLVGNFTVDVSGSNLAGIRWFELRRTPPGTGSWILYQEGTQSSSDIHRWMGSIAMNGDGDMALGYSVSSNTLYPGLRYAFRSASDPLGTMRTEESLVEGGGAQTVTNRWGDYSSMNVDPVDDRTFWFTGEYYKQTGSFDWSTRIGKFQKGMGLFVNVALYLEGAYQGTARMRTALAVAGDVPTHQPFGGAPWVYEGVESVASVGDSVVDWVLMDLVSGDPANPPMTLEDRRAGLILDTGKIVRAGGVGPVIFDVPSDSQYYLVVSPRNHLSVMSNNPLVIVDSLAYWDFRFAAGTAYPGDGSALKLLPGLMYPGLIGCDVTADGEITVSDFNGWLVDTKALATGYRAADCNMDGQVTTSDFNMWLFNTKAIYRSMVPAY
jgi:hypothetical protein